MDTMEVDTIADESFSADNGHEDTKLASGAPLNGLSTRAPTPPPRAPPLHPPINYATAPTMRGTMESVEGSANKCHGKWAMTDAQHSLPTKCSDFEFILIEANPGTKHGSFPVCGKYEGWFALSKPPPAPWGSHEKVPESMAINFSYPDAGETGYKLTGEGTNRFGNFIMEGKLSTDGSIVIYRMYVAAPDEYDPDSPEKAAPSERRRGDALARKPLSSRQLEKIERDAEAKRYKQSRSQKVAEDRALERERQRLIQEENEGKYQIAALKFFRESDPLLDEDGFSLNPEFTLLPLSSLIMRQPIDFALPEDWHDRKGKHPWAPYRTIYRNVYRPPLHRFSVVRNMGKFDDDCLNDRVPVCNCSPKVGCGERCQNRMLFLECGMGCRAACFHTDAAGQQQGPAEEDEDLSDGENKDAKLNLDKMKYCENTVIQRKAFPRTEVFRTGDKGFALRVADAVEANTVLIEYLGEVIDSEECERRMSNYKIGDDFYFASLGKGLMLDAKPMGSTARFANHSCLPNCELQKWTVLGEPRICLVSLGPMKAGEEITYNYQYFEDGLECAKRQPCRCGAPNCSGTIGGRVVAKAEDLWSSRTFSIMSGAKRYPLDQIYAHIDDAKQNDIPFNSPALRDMRAMVQDAHSWLVEAKQRAKLVVAAAPPAFTSLSEAEIEAYMVDQSVIQDLIDRAPRCVKLDEIGRLKTALKKATDADREIEVLQCIIDGTKLEAKPRSAKEAKERESKQKAKEEVQKAKIEARRLTREAELIRRGIEPDSAAVQALQEAEQDLEALAASVASSSASSSAMVVGSPSRGPPQALHAAIAPVIKDEPNAASASASGSCAVNGSAPSSSSAPAPAAKERRIVWEDLMISVRSTYYALPVRVTRTPALLAMYQDCSNWARKWVTSCVPKGFEFMSKFKDLWSMVDRMARAFDVEVSDDAFKANIFLDERLSVYIRREEQEAKDVALCQPVTLESNKGKGSVKLTIKKKAADEDDPTMLHCFCRLPEADGDVQTMTQCDKCSIWYHPNCVNSTIADIANLTSDKNVQKGLSGEFTCPLCDYNAGMLNGFAFRPEAEWKLQPLIKTKPDKAPAKVDGRTKNVKRKSLPARRAQTTSKPPPKAPKPRLGDPIIIEIPPHILEEQRLARKAAEDAARVAAGGDCSDGQSSDPQPLDAAENEAKTELQVPAVAPPPVILPRISTLAKPVTGDYLSMSSMREAQHQEPLLRVAQLPAALLMSLMQKKVEEWQASVQAFWQKPLVHVMRKYFLTRSFLAGPLPRGDSRTTVSGCTLAEEREVLREAMRLHLRTRLLRVKPAEAAPLRQLVWAISSSVYFRDFGPAVDKRISLAVLHNVIVGGRASGCKDDLGLLSALSREYYECQQTLLAGQSCSLQRVAEAEQLFNQRAMRITWVTEWPFARVMSLVLGEAKKSQFASRAGQEYVTACTADLSEERYCWCRMAEHGPMILCDKCEDWFHIDCISNPPEGQKKRAQEIIQGASSFLCIYCSEEARKQYKYIWACESLVADPAMNAVMTGVKKASDPTALKSPSADSGTSPGSSGVKRGRPSLTAEQQAAKAVRKAERKEKRRLEKLDGKVSSTESMPKKIKSDSYSATLACGSEGLVTGTPADPFEKAFPENHDSLAKLARPPMSAGTSAGSVGSENGKRSREFFEGQETSESAVSRISSSSLETSLLPPAADGNANYSAAAAAAAQESYYGYISNASESGADSESGDEV